MCHLNQYFGNNNNNNNPRSFAVWGSTSWNSLPQLFYDATPTLGQFQRRLKTSLFHLPIQA